MAHPKKQQKRKSAKARRRLINWLTPRLQLDLFIDRQEEAKKALAELKALRAGG
jgi:hypothetical protein